MIDFEKGNGLIPVIVQDRQTLEVLMLGYMDKDAWDKTQAEKLVTFYSRSKKRLWTKGEESGNHLRMVDFRIDCDRDALLILADPAGPTCHTGARNCFESPFSQNFIFELERIIDSRYAQNSENSYVNRLRNSGIHKIGQKVGEEAVETVIAALVEDKQDFVNESSDLIFHLLVLLREKNVSLAEIARNLESRHQ